MPCVMTSGPNACPIDPSRIAYKPAVVRPCSSGPPGPKPILAEPSVSLTPVVLAVARPPPPMTNPQPARHRDIANRKILTVHTLADRFPRDTGTGRLLVAAFSREHLAAAPV